MAPVLISGANSGPTIDLPPTRPHATDHNPLRLVVQPVFNPAHWSLFHFMNGDATGDGVKGFPKVEVNCPLLSPCPPSQLCHCRRQSHWSSITSSLQIHSGYSPSPSHHHVFGSAFQYHFLHHLPRDQGEIDRPLVSQIFPLALLEDGICSLPVFRNHSQIG